jgi:hypothetical protein
MALDDKSILNNKLSPLIEGQVPDFVQSDHPVFVEFLKDYYKFLEAGELTISTTVTYVTLETNTSSYVLDEEDGDRIVTEIGAGTSGYFIENETIAGDTSNATAQVLVDNSRNSKLYITSQQKFITGEKITGGTSGATGTIVEYRGNPVQNIQQMLDYADVDNTIYDFLDKMRDSFMVDIPSDLATGVSKRDLLKNIKDLYAAKGTSEGHKLFMRMLLGETADVFYPNQYMMKSSGGKWEGETVLRVLAFDGVTGEEVVNQIVTGEISGATATVVSSLVSQQTKNDFNDSVTELEIANITGTFDDSEIISGVSSTNDRLVKFTVFGIVSEVIINNFADSDDGTIKGNLYSKDEVVEIEVLGNDFAEVVVDEVSRGRVESVFVDDAGTDYAVGEVVTFISNTLDVDAVAATGEISMVGGGIAQESGTIAFFEDTDTFFSIVMEPDTLETLTPFNFILEETRQFKFNTDGISTVYSIGSDLNADTDDLVVLIDGAPLIKQFYKDKIDILYTNWSASGNTITFTEALLANKKVTIRHRQNDNLLLDRTDIVGGVTGSGTSAVGGSDSNYKIESNTVISQEDLFDANSRNQMVLEYDTFENLGVTSERGSIQAVRITPKITELPDGHPNNEGNAGYSKLPTLSITSVSGSGAKLLAIPDGIGGIVSVKINNNGFRYSATNPPDVNFKSHAILKDVSGTFGVNNSLTSHEGTVTSWDTTTNELVIKNFDITQKIVQEQDGIFNEGIQLEQGTEILTPIGFLLEEEQAIVPTGFSKDLFGNIVVQSIIDDARELGLAEDDTFSIEDRIVMDGTDVFDPYENDNNPFSVGFSGAGSEVPTERIIIKVTAEWNEASKTWAFSLNGKSQKDMTFYEGTEYYFDLSHPSLYGLETGQPVRQLQKSFALSLTPDGRDAAGARLYRETDNISTTQKYDVDGQLDLIRVGLGSKDSVGWRPPTNSPMAFNPALDPVIITQDTIQYDILEVADDVGDGRLILTYDQMLSLRPDIVNSDNEQRAISRSTNNVPNWMLDNPNYDRTVPVQLGRVRYTNPVTGEVYFGNGSGQYILNPNLKGPYLPDGSLIPNETVTIPDSTVGEGWTGGNYGSGTFGSYTDGIDGRIPSFSQFLKGSNTIGPSILNPEASTYRQPSNVFTGARNDPANFTPEAVAARMEGAQRAYLIAYPPPSGDAIERIYVQGTDVVAPYKPDYFVDSSIWTPLQYEKTTPISSFDPNSPQGLADRALYGTNGDWTADEQYAIEQGYIGAFLKLNVPIGGSPVGNKYYYYSPNFTDIGGTITVKRKPKVVSGAGDSIKFNATDKEEYGLILENASQDRVVSAGNEEATDQLIMEDGREYVVGVVKEDFERSLLLPSAGFSPSTSDAEYLSLYYRMQTLNAASTFEGYQNYINQTYEPTYFMNESYEPPVSFRPFICVMPSFDGKGTIPTPSAKDFTIPVRKPPIPLNTLARQILSSVKFDYFLESTLPPNPFFFPKKTSNEDGYVLIDSLREENVGFIVLNGTDANGSDAGSLVASEEFGNTLTLNGTDVNSSDAGAGFLLDDETGDGNILLDATASGVDVGDELVLEETLFSRTTAATGADITVTDSSGASGTVEFIDLAEATSTVQAVSEKTASYRGINNLIGEDLIRLQDSYYYQDFSYEVVVGQSLLTYFDELKKAVHPAGFQPFGKVSIATLVSAAVTNTAAGVSGYTGDTQTFSPILGSVLETIFSQVLQSRLQVPSTITADGQVPIGSRDDRIVQETGVLPGENLILDASAASTDVGSNLLFEDGDGLDLELGLTTAGDGAFLYEISTITYTDDVTNGTGDGGGRIMAETSHASSGNSDRSLVTQRVTKIESRPLPRFERNLLLYLAESPFGLEPAGITLETGSGNLVDNIIMDGEIPFNEGNAFMELERDLEIDNIILDGTDALGTNAGEGLILETSFFLKIEDPSLGRESETFDILFEDSGKLQLEASIWAFPIGYHVSAGDKLLLDTLDNDETIPLSDISSLTFEQIRTVEKFVVGLSPNEENWGGGTDDDNITMEDFGQILLDRTTDEGANAGSHLLQETSKRNRFTLEESGTLIVEDYSTLSNTSALTLESGDETGDIILESTLQGTEAFNIKLEDDDNLQGIIVLNGTDSAASDAGDKLDLELIFNELPNIHILALEEYNVFTNEGQIPTVNFRLNSTEVITKGNVRSAEISARSTGDIALEDSTDDTHGYLVLNSTSGSSTNAGENFDLEGATGITY